MSNSILIESEERFTHAIIILLLNQKQLAHYEIEMIWKQA